MRVLVRAGGARMEGAARPEGARGSICVRRKPELKELPTTGAIPASASEP